MRCATMARLGMVLLVALTTIGCLGPPGAERPEVELVETGEETPMGANVQREGDKVWIEGLRSRPAWITHMGCLMSCMEYLGNDASPAWAYGGTGFAFALNIHEAVCPSGPTAWPEHKCHTLASNIGVVVEPVLAHKSEGDLAATQQQAWRKVQEAIDAGLPCFGWELDIPEWYVIYGYDDEGNILFRDFGGEQRQLHYTKLGDTGIGVAAVMVVRPGPAADDRTTVRDALSFALEHGAGRHSHELWHTGLRGYGAWIAALENEELANTDEVIGFGQGYNGMCWAECRRRAFEFLQEAKERLNDDELAPLFDEAVEHYRTVSESLAQVSKTFPFDADEHAAMAERIRDLVRRERAVTALKTARDAEAAGLRTLAKIAVALGAQGVDPDTFAEEAPAPAATAHHASGEMKMTTGADRVKREDGKVWIEGVEGWSFAQRGSSVHAAMETVMRAVGEDVTYEYVLGTSALAFRMQVHNEWCPSSPHPWCGYQCVQGSVNALPWKVRAYEVKPDNADGVKEARAAVVASIDGGVPCAYGSEEDGIIYGYQKGGEEWLCVHPFRGGQSFVETNWPWGIGVYTERKTEVSDRRALVLASLKQAVEMAHTEKVEEYDCGFHAWEQWISRLRDEQWVTERSENEAGLMQGNSWIYCCLVEYRAAAAKYLRSVAGDFGEGAADHLRKAADLYEKMVEDVLLAGDCPLDVAPMRENLKEGEQWTQATRNDQAKRLESALALERQAIAEIEKALAVLN